MDRRRTAATLCFVALIALLGVSAYLSSDRAQADPTLKAALITALN